MELAYDYPLYRPPSEARSMIFQVTLGCSFNECSFCDMYRSKEYAERPWDQVKSEIDLMARAFPGTRRVFLADGDALNLEADYMVRILRHLRSSFAQLERVSCYAMPMNLLKKTPAELERMRGAGLDMLYVGIESGSDTVLKKVTKGAVAATIVRACAKAREAGYALSCMVILGLGGKKYSGQHVRGTAEVLSAVKPDYVGALTLYMENGTKGEFLQKYGEPFERISDEEAVEELEALVAGIETDRSIVFRSNHGSNAYTVGGTLPGDKEAMLERIAWIRSHPETVRPQGLRGF